MEDYWIISALKEVGKFVVIEGLWPPVKCHVDYWLSLGDNIQGLRDEIRCLERERRHMDQRVEEARLRAESATADVENWSNEGTRKLEEATRILRDHRDLKVWNIISQYSVGKNAKRTAEGLEKLRKDGNSIVYAYPAPPPSMVSISDEPSMEFESRRHIEEEIIKSLSDDCVHVIAICGAGGVGKTTMARRIADRVRTENLFDEVVMVVVSQQIEMLKIQEEIAELLGLSFRENTLVGRAGKLRTRLLDSRRKLIIFDDVWESFKLGAIGVPMGNSFTMGKIILTSRVKDACIRMNAQKIIPMEILTKEEAWTLFKEKTGSHVEGSDLLPIAKQIVEECKGLPVSLVTVGKALKDQSMHVWRDSLSQLSRSIPIDFPEVIKEVYKPLKLSYDFLENESMKSLFELCSLFPEDYNIPIEWLTWYSIGLGILEGIKNIQEGRNRVYSFVEKLKSRFLLISGSWEHVKMHDVVRDVAIFICSKEKHGWLKSTEASSMDPSSKDSSRDCNWMSIDISVENAKLPVWSNFPNLRLLIILDSDYRDNFNDICLRGIEGLSVLYFSRLNYRSFPPSLKLLKKLRTLHLVSCEVEDISLVGELASLEILAVHFCGNIKEFPIYVGRLNHLKVLELKSCRQLKRIAPGVISSLVGLEELKIINCFDKWEPKENQSEERNASLSELESLPSLTFLDIHISDCNLVAQEICLSQRLARYLIASGDHHAWRLFSEVKHERNIALTLQGDVTIGNWIRQLIRRTQSLVLRGDGSNSFNLSETESLRYLMLEDCSTVKRVVNSTDCKFIELEHLELQNLDELEEIIDGKIPEKSNSFQKLESLNLCNLPKLVHLWKSLNQNVSGGNLKSISIENCPNLRYVLSAATARTLVQLQDLKVLHCDMIEQVFWNEIGSNTYSFVIELPTLKELILFSLPNLTTFSHGVDIIECPQLTRVQIRSCPKFKTRIGKCPKLRDMRLSGFNGLDHPLSSSVTRKWNMQLQAIEICDCDTIKEILWGEIKDAGNGHIIFPELKKLGLSDLPCFTTFYRGVESIKFLKLEELTIRNLPRMNSFAPMDSEPPHDDHSLHFFCNQKVEFPCLRKLRLEDLHDIRSNIWCRNVPISFFHNLDRLVIFRINGIKNFMPSSIAKHLVNLEYLWIKSCPDMVEVIEDENEVPVVSLFPKLQVLNIQSLHTLRSFCQWKHAFELPLLIIVVINDCPRIETFTLGSLSTPSLRTFKINNEMVETKDLNAGIHDHFTTEEETGDWSARSSKRKRI